jgi:hypothetical protein
MNDPSPQSPPMQELIERIARRLISGGADALLHPLPIPATTPSDVVGPRLTNQPSSTSTPIDPIATTTAGTITSATPADPHCASIADRVVTIASLQSLNADTRSIRVPANAVITPSARDMLQSRRMEIIRQSLPQESSTTKSKRPASMGQVAKGPLWIFDTRSNSQAASLQKQLAARRDCRIAATMDAALAALQGDRSDDVVVLVLTDRPATVACQANRNHWVRAAIVRGIVELADLREQLQPNAWIFDIRHCSLATIASFGARLPC